MQGLLTLHCVLSYLCFHVHVYFICGFQALLLCGVNLCLCLAQLTYMNDLRDVLQLCLLESEFLDVLSRSCLRSRAMGTLGLSSLVDLLGPWEPVKPGRLASLTGY